MPLDRVLRKSQNLAAIANDEAQAWQQLFLLLGWNQWDLGMGTSNNSNLFGPKLDLDLNLDLDLDLDLDDLDLSPLNKRLPKGVIGRANGDGTIDIKKGLSPEKRRKTIAHELEHARQMKNGTLGFNDCLLYTSPSPRDRTRSRMPSSA